MKFAHLFVDFAGPLIVVHIGLSLVLRALVGWKSELVSELFGPASPSVSWGLRLLRFKYFLLWQPQPKAVVEKSARVQVVFMLARVSGALASICALGLIANMVYVVLNVE
jgi:hypothetical protein